MNFLTLTAFGGFATLTVHEEKERLIETIQLHIIYTMHFVRCTYHITPHATQISFHANIGLYANILPDVSDF